MSGNVFTPFCEWIGPTPALETTEIATTFPCSGKPDPVLCAPDAADWAFTAAGWVCGFGPIDVECACKENQVPSLCPVLCGLCEAPPTTTTVTELTTTLKATTTPKTTEPAPAVCVGRSIKGDNGACKCGGGCHTCDYTGGVAGACTLCKNAKYLRGGKCLTLSECEAAILAADEGGGPSGKPSGEGNFGRLCGLEVAVTKPPVLKTTEDAAMAGCQDRKNDCHVCADSDTCKMCRNRAYLHDGVCTSSCPDGYQQQGNGMYSRKCVVAQCNRKSKGCHKCSANNTKCKMCYNKKYLLGGVCVKSCPDGTTGM